MFSLRHNLLLISGTKEDKNEKKVDVSGHCTHGRSETLSLD